MNERNPLLPGRRRGIELPVWLERVISVGIVTADPERARRQRITNVAAFATCANAVSHAVINSFYNFQGLALVNFYNVAIAIVAALIPLLHRFGTNVAAIALVCTIIAGQIFIILALGLASDLHIYFTLAGAMLLFFGLEHLRLFFGFFLLVTVVLLLALNYAPVDGFVLPQDGMLRDMLSSHAMINTIVINAAIIFYALTALRKAELDLEDAHARSERLVHAIMPAHVAARLESAPGDRVADRIESLSVMFADLAGFTGASRDRDPAEVVDYLDRLVRGLEALCERHGVEKIKTIGDGFMAAAGFEGDANDGARRMARLGLAIVGWSATQPPLGATQLRIRIGIHCGPAMAGVIGGTRFSYDVWGHAVNVAARLEAAGEPGRVHVSEAFAARLAGEFAFEPRGTIEIKGVGGMQTLFLTGERSAIGAG
jgi:adenylate cyclase